MRYILFSFFIILGFSLGDFVYAGEGLVTCSGGDCTFCSFVEMVNELIHWLIVTATIMVALLIAFAGFELLTARGNTEALTKAKKHLINSFVGIVIMLLGWTIVDTFLKVVAGGDLGVWNVVECGGENAMSEAQPLSVTLDTHDGPSVIDDAVDAVEGPESMIGQGGAGFTPSVVTPNGRVSFAFSSSLSPVQQGHLSSTLASFQGCIAQKIPAGQYIITSVSDNAIASGAKTWQYCAEKGQSGGCAHTSGSCHYGGRSCVGASYALDIRTSNLNSAQQTSVLQAAEACGGWGQNEGNHLHVSKGSACGCQ